MLWEKSTSERGQQVPKGSQYSAAGEERAEHTGWSQDNLGSFYLATVY